MIWLNAEILPFEEVAMTVLGLKIEQAGHVWEVVSIRREGAQMRISFRAAAHADCRAVGYVDGTDSPPSSLVTAAIQNPTYRWFPDPDGRVWRAETSPRYDYGSLNGQWLRFAAEDGPDRAKYPTEAGLSLGVLQDVKLVEYLLRAIKGL